MIFDTDAFADLIARKVAGLLGVQLDTVLTTEQAAELLQVHPNTVLSLAGKGELPGRKVGRDWRFRKSALLDHLTSTAQERVPESLPLAGD